MVDVSGIPNMGFGGGSYFGGIPNQQPAMSAAQINAGIWGNYSPQQAQATAAAATQPTPYGYGFVTSLAPSFGPAAAPGTYSPGSGLSSFSGVPLGGGGGGGGYSGGGIGSDAYRGGQGGMSDPWNPYAAQLAQQGGGGIGSDAHYGFQNSFFAQPQYNAPRQYGWDANEGAPAPAAPQVYNRGEFNPQTYGWDANEGADPYQGQQNFQDLWNDRGRVYQPPFVPSPYGPGGAPTGISPPVQQSSIWDTYGGPDVQAAARAAGRSMADFGPEHLRSFGLNEGRGIFDKAAYLDKYQDVKNAGVDAYQHYLQFGKNEGREAPMTTNRDVLAGLLSSQAVAGGTPSGTRSPVPDARTYMPSGQFGGYLDHYLWGANSGSLGRSGLMGGGSDTASLGGYPFGGYVPQGGANDPFNPYAAQLAQQGGGVGSDIHYGGQNAVAGYGAAQDMMRAGRGWTIAQQPPAVSQEMLGNRINQGIYDIGNAGDAYSRSIGGGFGMNMPSQSQGLTAQDLVSPSAYPPGFRMDQQ